MLGRRVGIVLFYWMKVPIQISHFFWGGGGITQEQEPSWAPDSEEPNYRYPLVSLRGISIALLTEKWATHFLHFDLTVWWCCVAFSHTPIFEIPTRCPSNDGLLSLPIYLHSAWKSRKKGLFRVEDLSYIRSMEYPGTVQDNHEVLLLYVYIPSDWTCLCGKWFGAFVLAARAPRSFLYFLPFDLASRAVDFKKP